MDDSSVNLGEEVILTSAFESATVCFVISLSIWCVCVRVRAWERETRSHNRGLCANTYEHHHCVGHATLFPSRAWNDGKTKDIINGLYIYFYISDECLWCSANHNAMCQLANQSRLRLSEGGAFLPTIMYSIWKRMCFLNIKACQHILLHQIHKIMIFKKASNDPF